MSPVRGVHLNVIKRDLLDDIDIKHAALNADGCDILALNAGVQQSRAIVDIPLQRISTSFDINMFGYLQLVQALVWLSSVAGLQAAPFLGAYSATNHAIEPIIEPLTLELAPLSIQMATVARGIFATGFNDTALESAEQWLDTTTPLITVPDMTDKLTGKCDPQDMVDAMIEIVPAEEHLYRTMRPLETISEIKAAQAHQWQAAI